jgi:hypothetical protein
MIYGLKIGRSHKLLSFLFPLGGKIIMENLDNYQQLIADAKVASINIRTIHHHISALSKA